MSLGSPPPHPPSLGCASARGTLSHKGRGEVRYAPPVACFAETIVKQRKAVSANSQRCAASGFCDSGAEVARSSNRPVPPLSETYRGRAGRQGIQPDPRASAPRDIEACRSPARLRSVELRRVNRKSAKPKASRARCLLGLLRTCPRWSAVRHVQPHCGAAFPPFEALALGRHASDACPGLPAVRGLGARSGAPGRRAAWTAGPLHRISDAKSFPGHRSPPHV